MIAGISQNSLKQSQSLEQLLLDYLTAILPGRIPGCDGMTTQHMLRHYADLAGIGLVPGVHELKRWHPDFAAQLDRFFVRPTEALRRSAEEPLAA